MDMSSYYSSLELQREGARVTGLARGEDDFLIPTYTRSRNRRFVATIVAAMTFIAVLGSAIIYRNRIWDDYADVSNVSVMEDETSLEVSSSDTIIHVTASNAYGDQTQVNYPWLRNKILVEPSRITTLGASTRNEDAVGSESLSFAWKIQYHDDSLVTDEAEFRGLETIEYTFKKIGEYTLSVTATNQLSTIRTEHAIACRYVKREIRNLLVEDREAFLDAAFSIWKFDTDVGRKIYGKTFTGMDIFAREHAAQATGDIACDHWHEGSGFLPHHVALTISFDMSLRSIDPSVTLPYWDFTIEGNVLNNNGQGPSSITTLSPVFTHDWFGAVDAFSHVKNSRWAHVSAVMATDSDASQNSYGIIRAPWNNAKDTELLRHMSDVCGLEPVNKAIPTCATHYGLLEGAGETLGGWLLAIAGNGHGPLHVNTGGVFGQCEGAVKDFYSDYAEELSQNVTLSEISNAIETQTGIKYGWNDDSVFSKKDLVREKIHLEYFHIYRSLYRSQICALDGLPGALSCPESCDPDAPDDECLCLCKGIDKKNNTDFDWKNVEPCLYASDSTRDMFTAVVSEEMRKGLITSMCSAGVKEGEQLESASPVDPVFWLIHPILDRMTTVKRLAALQDIPFGDFGSVSGFDDTEWIDYSFYSTDNYSCTGHGMHDAVLPHLPIPQRLIDVADSNGDGHLSNIEFWEGVDPVTGDGLDYVFDNFDWSHCSTNSLQATNNNTALSQILVSNGIFSGWSSEKVDSVKPGGIHPSQPVGEYHRQLVAFKDGIGRMPGRDLRLVK